MFKNKDKFTIRLLIAGLVNLILPFILPFFSQASGDNILGAIASMSGVIPKRMTAFELFKFFTSDLASLVVGLADQEQLDTVRLVGIGAFFIPVVTAVVILLVNFLCREKPARITSIVCGAVLTVYTLFTTYVVFMAKEDIEGLGYKINVIFLIIYIAAAVATLCLAVMALMNLGGESEKVPGGKKVHVGKNDGKITGLRGAYAGAVIPVGTEQVIIGRDPASSNIVIKSEKASRKHCVVTYNAASKTYSVTDYSVNGTYDGNGNRLSPKSAVLMPAGSQIQIGKDGDIFILG